MSNSAPLEYIQIKDLKTGMKNINAVFIVLDVSPPTLTKEAREVRTLRVADTTACINFSVWDEAGTLLQPGDIVRLQRGFTNMWRSALTLYSGKNGDIQKIDEFCMLFNEEVNMSLPVPAGAAPAAPASLGPASGPGAPLPQAGMPGYGPERYAADRERNHGHKTYNRGRGSHRGNSRRN